MKRYKHNLSYYNLTTCDMGELIPVGLTEALPGDTIQHDTNALIRVSPLAAPIMHNVTARLHHFFVPHRLVWDGWEDFITAGPDGNDASVIPAVQILDATWDVLKLPDYLGIPRPKTSSSFSVNALPIRCYNLIYNEFYRDQDLQTESPQDNPQVLNVCWEKDYFTTARPWTQKGPEVTIPLGNSADVKVLDAPNITPDSCSTDSNNFAFFGGSTDPDQRLYADLANAEAVDVNEFRKAFALQRYAEARARYGSRYTEYLRYLGVTPKDSRLQRPEFLGGGRVPLQFSEVLQTAPETGVGGPSTEFGVGDLYGHGIAAMRSNKYRRFIEEHGYIMTLLSVRPKAIYPDGMDRTWLRRHREDFFQKELQHIGQQEIYYGEVYGDNQSPDSVFDVFGYQDRYAEYRQNFSKVTGEFRNILNYWHMGREFESKPALNHDFVNCVPTKRIHNEQTQHALWIMVQHKMAARRLVDRSAMPRIY